MMKILLIPLLIISITAFSQTMNDINIVPRPAEIKMHTGKFIINNNTQLVLEGGGLEKIANFLNDYLQTFYGLKLKITKKSGGKNEIVLNFERINNPLPGAYSIEINNAQIYISGDNEAGIFYGIQTFLQLLPTTNPKLKTTSSKLSIPQLSVKDAPRFPYRGMHLDVSRHFFSVDLVKKYLDYLAYHKFNTFHWHLTDDQGWRIEIKKYPKLTSVGGFRNGTIIGRFPGKGNDGIKYGGFYTQEEIKDIVKYAADRYITIIPEIEMPGHSSAAIAAYPQLSCFSDESTKPAKGTAWSGSAQGKQVQQAWGVFEDVYSPTEYTFHFLEDVLDEVMELFPSKYIHIGGDECPKENWKRSAFCQQLIKEKNLKDEHGLQSYFIQRIEKYLNSKGKSIIGWDEILEGGLAPNATVMSWRGEAGGITAANQNHNVIMTPENPLYLNHAQVKNEDSVTQGGFNPIENVYSYDPVSSKLKADKAKYILGAQGNVWTEYIGSKEKLEYMIFPRMSALSEALWSPKEKKDWKDFERRLPAIIDRYEMWGANYSNAYYGLQATVLPTPDYNGVLWKLESKNKNATIGYVEEENTALKTHKPYYKKYSSPILIIKAGSYAGWSLNGSGKSNTITQNFSFNKATGKKITLKDEPSINWSGNGAFTLVNGIITDRKLEQSSEWLGFLGKNIEATIDLGKEESIFKVRFNTLKQEGSWIYPPSSVDVQFSNDGEKFYAIDTLAAHASKTDDFRTFSFEGKKKTLITQARFVKVIAKNYGIIPTGQPGAGTPAWLFADEIEVE